MEELYGLLFRHTVDNDIGGVVDKVEVGIVFLNLRSGNKDKVVGDCNVCVFACLKYEYASDVNVIQISFNQNLCNPCTSHALVLA